MVARGAAPTSGRVLTRRSLPELAKRWPDRVQHVLSLPPATIPLPPLRIGASFLGRWPIRTLHADAPWQAESYQSMAPALFVINDAIVHSSAGIIAVGPDVIHETTVHTLTDKNRFRLAPAGGVQLQYLTAQRLPGTHLSILAGGAGNYFHSVIESVMRLAMVPRALLTPVESLLKSEAGLMQDEMLRHLGLPPHLGLRAIADSQTLRVERLIYPWSIHGEHGYHPCILPFFDRIAAAVAADGTRSPAPARPDLIYIDRRGAAARPMVNEDDVVAALSRLGFVPVQLERLSFSEQVTLFRTARAIVAPHGAGLTNLCYCQPGCAVLEIMMDASVNWLFRHLAALRGVTYDCILGRALDPWDQTEAAAQQRRWSVSVDLLTAAAGTMLAFARRS